MTTPLQQTLLDSGYTKHVSNSYKTFHSTDTLFQKCIRDNNGKKYFINMWWYDFSFMENYPVKESIQTEVQFTLKDGERVDITSFYKDIDKIELQMEEFWVKMGFDYCDD